MKEKLMEQARLAMEKAYAPYSHFQVGAALLGEDGNVYTGCNVENAAYSPTMCAERVAIGKAVSSGCRRFTALAVCGGDRGQLRNFCTPCGVCRQVLAEFCSADFPVYVTDGSEIKTFPLAQLLPEHFSL